MVQGSAVANPARRMEFSGSEPAAVRRWTDGGTPPAPEFVRMKSRKDMHHTHNRPVSFARPLQRLVRYRRHERRTFARPQSAVAHLGGGRSELEAGFALGRHILRYWPRHLDTYTQLGLAALTVGLYADAADLLRRALSADPEAGQLWAGLRQAASALGQGEEAELARQYEQDLLGLLPDAKAAPAAPAVKAGSAARWSRPCATIARLSAPNPDAWIPPPDWRRHCGIWSDMKPA